MTVEQRIDQLTKNLERIGRMIEGKPDFAISNNVQRRIPSVAARILAERARANQARAASA